MLNKIKIITKNYLCNLSIRNVVSIFLTIFFLLVLGTFVFAVYKAIYVSIYSERIEKIEYVVEFAKELLKDENKKVVENEKSLAKAQQKALDLISIIQFGKNDYLWIYDYDGKMIYHPMRKLIGTNLSTLTDIKNDNFGKDLVEIPNTKGSGYVSYYWPKPEEKDQNSYPKVSYISGFKPWGWVVGMGVYTDDIEQKVNLTMFHGSLPVLLIFIIMLYLIRNIVLRFFVKPIENLSDATLRFAENDFSVDIPKFHNIAEIEKLYKSFALFSAVFQEKNENKNKLSSILNSINDVILTINKKGQIKSANPAVRNIFGYNPEQLFDHHITDLLPNITIKNEQICPDDTCFIEKNNIETKGLTKDGTTLILLVSFGSINLTNEDLTSITLHDITKQKEIENMKNQFISTVSHELRTPLTSIKGSLGLISGGVFGKLPKKAHEMINIATNNCTRLVTLINDILDLEKIQAGKMDFNYNIYEVDSLVQEALQENKGFADQHKVELEYKTPIHGAYVNVDKDKFIHVLTNLLSNAVKFSEEGSKVEVCATREKKSIKILVKDYGLGIKKEHFDNIFDNFYQVDSSDSRKKGGTGLGLSICQKIVKKMGGTINFDSEYLKGSSFYFELPEIYSTSGNNKKALIIEDSKTAARMIEKGLNKLDFEVDIAITSQEARNCLKENNYDLITLDVVLPDDNGLNLIKTIRSTNQNPIIIISTLEIDVDNIPDNKNIYYISKNNDFTAINVEINNIIHNEKKDKLKIIHIEDDKDIINIVEQATQNKAIITKAESFKEAKELLINEKFDILLLDYVLKDGNGVDVMDFILKTQNKNIKTIVFSAFDEAQILQARASKILLKSKISNEKLLEVLFEEKSEMNNE